MPDDHSLAILEALKTLGARFDALEKVFARQPDLTLVLAQLKAGAASVQELRREVRMLSAAVNGVARENVTPGDFAAVHSSLDTLEQARDAFEARLIPTALLADSLGGIPESVKV
jgi:hypothetical protein